MIDKNLIVADVDVTTKDEAFELLSRLVVKENYANDAKKVLLALQAREKEGTTGMMDGFAIPHAKSDAIVKPGVAVLKLKKGVEWESMDGKLITVVIALFIPENQSGTTHLQYLSKIARLLMKKEFKDTFEVANTVDSIAKLLEENLNN